MFYFVYVFFFSKEFQSFNQILGPCKPSYCSLVTCDTTLRESECNDTLPNLHTLSYKNLQFNTPCFILQRSSPPTPHPPKKNFNNIWRHQRRSKLHFFSTAFFFINSRQKIKMKHKTDKLKLGVPFGIKLDTLFKFVGFLLCFVLIPNNTVERKQRCL